MLEKMNLIIKNNYKSCNVSCSRLSDVLESHLVKKIAILIIDVEGADYMVFDQFDFSKYSPYIVCVEIKHMSETNIEKLISKLKLEGYNVKRHRKDVLGIKEI